MFATNIRMKPVTYELDLGSFVDLIQLIKLLAFITMIDSGSWWTFDCFS